MNNTENPEEMIKKSLTTEEQEAAAFLRERFLFLLATIPAESTAEINMRNDTKTSAKIRAFDLSFENILVDNLQTPYKQPCLTRVLLRTQDVLSVSYNEKLGVV